MREEGGTGGGPPEPLLSGTSSLRQVPSPRFAGKAALEGRLPVPAQGAEPVEFVRPQREDAPEGRILPDQAPLPAPVWLREGEREAGRLWIGLPSSEYCLIMIIILKGIFFVMLGGESPNFPTSLSVFSPPPRSPLRKEGEGSQCPSE